MEGAEPARCMRQALPVFSVKSNSFVMTMGESGTYAAEVAEGAEIPIDVQDYTARTFTIKKYGVRPLISRELVDDGMFDVVALEVQKAGFRLENTLNQQVLTMLLDSAGNENDCDVSGTPTEADAGIKAIAATVGLIKADGFVPDTIVMSPAFEALVMKEFVPTGYVGADAAMSGRVPSLLGLKAYSCGATDASSTYTWGYGTDGYIGAAVFDSKNATPIAMRRDVSLEKYSDPIRDLVGCSMTMRFGTNYLFADAIGRIEY
jgi:HK97 family phage major capsid protein